MSMILTGSLFFILVSDELFVSVVEAMSSKRQQEVEDEG